MLRMFTVFTLCPKIPSQEFLVCKMLRVHKFTDAKGLLEKDREMRETHQSSLLGMPWRKVDHCYNRF